MDTKQKIAPLRVSEIRYNSSSGESVPVGFWARIDHAISDSLALTALARLSAVAFLLVTGTFFLLSSFVFSWLNIVRNENVLWIPKLANIYTPAYWTVAVLNALTLLPALRRRTSRWLLEVLLVALFTIGLALTRIYMLTDLPLGPQNIAWSVVIALPLLCCGIHDLVMFGNSALWRRQGETWHLPLRFAVACGSLAATWYAAIATVRHPELRSLGSPLTLVVTTSLLMHICAFASIAAALACISVFARWFKLGQRTRWIISLVCLWFFAAVLLRKLVAPALSFNNAWADVWAGLYPVAFIVALAGWQVRYSAVRSTPLPGRVEEILSGLFPKKHIWTVAAIALALFSTLAVPLFIERVDWDFLFQRTTVIFVWVALLTATWRLLARPAEKGPPALKSIFGFVLATACLLVLAQSSRVWHNLGWRNTERANSAYHGVDVSFQVGQLFFRPAIRDTDTTGLLPYLRSNALIGDPIGPPSLKLTGPLTPTTAAKPDIYIVVIDCMRRDYLSAYNPRVTFTPHMKDFAKESFVFENAYTSYGGTALSEPAIWAGAMMPSKHYVAPFADINALEKLTSADGYQRVITTDRILKLLLTPTATDTWINWKDNQYFGIDVRDTVHQLDSWQASGSQKAPLFFYTQPQNLYPITLHEVSETGTKVSADYPGFNARYADELHKADEAFGQFISNLKARGRFDNSIIILTADHGEWLGEYGRWGHAQSLLPPVIEVPLMVHLPKSLSKQFFVNTKQTVFLTDITPSLYYLLGHHEINKNEFFGRPLFTQTAAEQSDYPQRYHFMMSSYGAVFAILDENNQMLYQADAVDDAQSVFNLTDDHYGLDNLIDQESQPRYEKLVRGSITRLNNLYGYSPTRQ